MGTNRQRQVKYIGPWPDGLSTRHEGSYDVAETYLNDVINYDISDYGVLIPRAGFVRFHDAWGDGWPASFTNYGPLRLLGSHPTDVAQGNLRLYLSQLENRAGSWMEDVFFTDDPTTGSPTLLFSNNHGASEPAENKLFSQVVLYNGKLYFIRRGQAAAGSFINNVVMDNGDSTGATVVGSGGSQSFGYYAFVMQDRVFIVALNGSKVSYTKATDPLNWAAPDGGFFNVSPSDAQQITAVLALEDIVYIFKENTTYAFTFNTDPAVDGILRLISRDYGAYDATQQGGAIYVINRHGIFNFVDGQFVDIAQNISNIVNSPLAWSNQVSLTAVENKLIVGCFYESGSFTSLCMNINTGAWTKYQPADVAIGPTSKRSYIVSQTGGKTFMVWGDWSSSVQDDNISSGTGYLTMMRLGQDLADPDDRTRDQDKLGNVWIPNYFAVTVPLALDDQTRWKRLYRWRFDIQHSDEDNNDAFTEFEIREGDPNVVDQTTTAPGFLDYYTDFFESVKQKGRRFRVIQFGINKDLDQTGAGIADTTTHRVRGLSMDYAIKGPLRG